MDFWNDFIDCERLIVKYRQAKRSEKHQRKVQLAKHEQDARARKKHRAECVAKEKKRRAAQQTTQVYDGLYNPSPGFDEAQLFKALSGR